MKLNDLVKKNLAFLIPVLILISTGIVFLVLYDRDTIHITHNGWFNSYMDLFFTYDTYLGDGFIFPLIAFVLLFVKWRYFIGFILASLLTLVIIGFLKNVVFHDNPRPSAYFQNKYELRVIEGVELHRSNSFPSGHTAFAFSSWGFLAFIIRSGYIKFFMFGIAASVGYSRMYLSQHFLIDVVSGAFLGTLIAMTAFLLMQRLRHEWTDKKLKLKRRPVSR